MPGHASAALASYPELSCGLRKDYVVRDYFDVFDEVYCPKEHTFDFLENVLVEVMELFPSHYIHIGGDECPKKAWKKCIHCQTLMKKEGLPDEEALQSWFIHKIEQFVNSRGVILSVGMRYWKAGLLLMLLLCRGVVKKVVL